MNERSKSLLIVDDDTVYRQRLAVAMEKRGFIVRQAESVAGGIAAAKTEANRDPVAVSAAAPAVKSSVASAPSQSFIVTPVAPAQPYAVATLPERLLTRPVGTRAPPANCRTAQVSGR